MSRRTREQLHSRSVHGFPYGLIHVSTDNEVFFLAYAQERRRPGYWRDRLTDLAV
ncbi:hypothetical protein [Ornithinimicrobium faecis]|uniref:hypothetical protein n=1 Tax=Ornithinimicrobium faecis TaxID=2934158 RepID=UPI002118D2A8|nr:hypothetical protein [Ornithinimicrobium sp. HY1745]